MINITQNLLKQLSGGELQQLAFEFLPRVDDQYSQIINQGAPEGTAKTRTGTPDLWIFSSEEIIIRVEVTCDPKTGKLQSDLEKNLRMFRDSHSVEKEYIIFVSYEPKLEEIEPCKKICQSEGIKLTLFDNKKISNLLNQPDNHDLRRDYLDIQLEYGVFLTQKEFESRLQIRSTKLPFNTSFIGRETEIQETPLLLLALIKAKR